MKSLLLFVMLGSFFKLSAQDSLIYLVKYNFSWQKDSSQPNSKYIDIMNLEIGKHSSHYYSSLKQLGLKNSEEDLANNVSLEYIMQNEGKYFASSESEIIEIYFDSQIVKVSNKFTKKCYFFTEKLEVPKWKLENDTLSILNVLCQKATTSFKGRDYIAWFAPSIPYHLGPWYFTGLPGIILKINDSKNQLAFECTQLSFKPQSKPIFKEYVGCIETSHEKLKELVKIKETDLITFSQMEYPGVSFTVKDANGNIQNMKPKLLPYNPIDLTK